MNQIKSVPEYFSKIKFYASKHGIKHLIPKDHVDISLNKYFIGFETVEEWFVIDVRKIRAYYLKNPKLSSIEQFYAKDLDKIFKGEI